MGCGCLKVRTDTESNKQKTIATARRLAELENQTYIIYGKEESIMDSLAGWEQDGRPGTTIAIVEP
jgi:hypothetical protein